MEEELYVELRAKPQRGGTLSGSSSPEMRWAGHHHPLP